MEQETAPTFARFADLVASQRQPHVPAWAINSRTTLAHGTGRLPIQRHQNGWQTVAGPGSANMQRSMTPSMRSLHQRIVRGEA